MTIDVNVLLVEDSDIDARRIETLLRYCTHIKCVFHRATDLASTLAILQDRDIDLVILDPGLPDADGLQAVQVVAHKFIDVPLVVMTGADDFQSGRDCIKAGAQEYLPKSDVRSQSLERVIVYAMERKYAQVQVQRYYRDSLQVELPDSEETVLLEMELKRLQESIGYVTSLVKQHAPHILPKISSLLSPISTSASRPKNTRATIPAAKNTIESYVEEKEHIKDPRAVIANIMAEYEDEK